MRRDLLNQAVARWSGAASSTRYTQESMAQILKPELQLSYEVQTGQSYVCLNPELLYLIVDDLV